MPDLTPTPLLCAHCHYDLRAQPPDGICPECETPVAHSRRLAAIPRRPPWPDTDPRWRRRMLAGTWTLTLIPLLSFLLLSPRTATLIVPDPLPLKGDLPLNETLATMTYVYFTFCIGTVLLFSNERHRRPAPLDWTRRWGVTGSYGVLLLGIPYFAFIAALVTVGIAAVFLSMPLKNQPRVTDLFVNVGSFYLHHGPISTVQSEISLPAFAAITILLASIPLYNALRAAGARKWSANLLLAPFWIAALLQFSDLLQLALGFLTSNARGEHYPFYFDPQLLTEVLSDPTPRALLEAAKWTACLTIALWLTTAQLLTWRHRPTPTPV